MTILLAAAAAAAAGCSDPARSAPPAPPGTLTITAGGTYAGTWVSPDPDTPAIVVRTADPVVIDGATVSGRGVLIRVAAPHADVTVRNVTATGSNPNVVGRHPGRFVEAEGFDRVVVDHCTLARTAGIYLLTNGDRRRTGAVRVVNNFCTDIDGRLSDGHGGWLSFNDRKRRADGRHEQGYAIVQFVQLDKVRAPAMEIGWNRVENAPFDSRVEDNVNVYQSGGTSADAPLLVHDNFVRGAYSVDPTRGGTTDGPAGTDDWSYAGGGLLLGDGPAPTVADAASFVRATGNVVVGTVNYGIAVAAGHDIAIDGNRVVAARTLPDGRPLPAQNVGVYVWDANHNKPRGTFFNVTGTGNTIGWAARTGGRNDTWTPDATAFVGTVHLSDPITPDTEAAERTAYLARAATAGVTFGVTPKAGR